QRYFDKNNPSEPAPSFARWTQSKVNTSVRVGKVAPTHPLLAILDRLALAIVQFERAAQGFQDELCAALCDEIQRRLTLEHQRLGSQSFDSLLSDLCLALRDRNAGTALASQVRQRLPVALIDEFQDTD